MGLLFGMPSIAAFLGNTTKQQIHYERGSILNDTQNFNQITLSTVPKKLKSKSLPIVAGSPAPQQAELFKQLVESAQGGNKNALGKLCAMFEPLFVKEMRREIFYGTLGFEEGLSLARLRFIEIILNYNGADFAHFAGYIRCRIHYALYDEARKIWNDENKKAPLPANDEAESAELCDNVIERKELNLLLQLALQKLPPKQRKTISLLYLNGYNNKETAHILNCTPAMVTKHHKQALKNLRQNIA
mgnify:CR=1 FL=1